MDIGSHAINSFLFYYGEVGVGCNHGQILKEKKKEHEK